MQNVSFGSTGRPFLILHAPIRNPPQLIAKDLPDKSVRIWCYSVDETDMGQLPTKQPRPHAPRCLPVFVRTTSRTAIPGAIIVPTPHQFTIFPTVVCVEFDETQIENLPLIVNDALLSELGFQVPVEKGFRRVRSPGSIFPSNDVLPFDLNGYPRIGGNNAIEEYSDVLPHSFSWPGWLSRIKNKQNQLEDWTWSAIIKSADGLPTTRQEAADMAPSVDQVMTSMGNLWFLNSANIDFRNSDPTLIGVRALSDLSALVECAAAISSGRTRDSMNEANRKAKLPYTYEGSGSSLALAVRNTLSSLPTTRGLHDRIGSELEKVCAVWKRVRNADAHDPRPIVYSGVDFSSQHASFTPEESNDLIAACFRIGHIICDKTRIIPVSAVSA